MVAPTEPTGKQVPDAQFRALVEHALVGMAIVQDGRYLYVNPKYCEIFGYSRNEFLAGMTPLDVVIDVDRALVAESMKNRLTGAAAGVEYIFKGRRKDGTVIDVEVHGAAMRISGRPALISSLTDVSDRQRAAEKILEDETQFRALVEQGVAAIFVIQEDMTIGYVNRHFAELVGYQSEEAIGRPLLDFIAGPDKSGIAAAAQSLMSGAMGSIQVAAAIKRKDGGLVDLLSHGTMATFRGRPAIFGVAMDVTEHKKAESDLAASELRYRRLFEAAQDGILILDGSTGQIVDVNPFLIDMLGYSREEYLGKRLWEIAPLKDAAANRTAFGELQSTGYIRYEDLPLEGKDGHRVDVEFVSNAYDAGSQRIIQCNIRNITARVRAESALQRSTRAVRTLGRGNAALVRATSQEELFREMCQLVVEVGGHRMAWIGLAENDAGRSVRTAAVSGYDAGYLGLAKISWADDERGRGPTGTAIRTGTVQINRDFAHNPLMEPWRAEALKRGYASSIALPLLEGERAFGALTIYAPEPDAFNADEVRLLTELASDLSYGVIAIRTRADRLEGLRRLERSMEDTVRAVASIVEMRDAYTAGHQRRVARLAEAIAGEMGLSADRIHGLRLACIVHDLGKIRMPAEILSKPGKLTPLEYRLVQTHPQVGYDILKPIEFPWPIADMVLQHHERLDGSGYPGGLTGDAILLEAKIMAVADVVEAMMSHRPYRPALGWDAALGEIRRGRGTLYDPAAVDACLKLAQAGAFKFD